MSADSEMLLPPNEPAAFESLCLDLWRDVWGDAGAQKNGRSGQPQAGVDVYGQHNGRWVGVQCKQKDNLLWTKLTAKQFEAEVNKACEFKPPLSAFILATSGPADAKVQQRARELTQEHSARGLFTVEAWSWEKIWHEIYGREALFRHIGPIYWAQQWKLIEDRLRSKAPINTGPPGIFLSYARADGEAFATALRQRLEREPLGLTLWQDRARMEGGVGWWKQIEEALDAVQFLVVVMTPGALASETTRKEWRYARQKGVIIYPVKGVPDEQLNFASLPKWMAKAHWFSLGALDARGALTTGPEWETFVRHLQSHHERRRVPFMAPDLPEGYVPRPAEFNQLRAHLLSPDRQNPVAITTALAGAGGFGKTTLAIALCHDDAVITAFDDGILWTTLGEKPDVKLQLTKLFAALTGERPAFLDEEEAARELANKLENRNCLLVVDDVWNAEHLKPFLSGTKDCARLITTRQFDVLAELHTESRRVNVDQMSRLEAVALLTQGVKPSLANLRPFHLLARRLGEWPLLLGLANSALRQRMARGDTVAGAISFLEQALDRKGLTAFDQRNATQRHGAVSQTLAVSLELLEAEERKCYAELAIFPEDADIPLSAVGTLWHTDKFDTEQLLTTLANFSLIKFHLQTGTIRLHDVLRTYLVRQLPDLRSLHERLLQGWGNLYLLPDAYSWRWLAYHLDQAGQQSRLLQLLLDFRWLQASLEATDIELLIAFYNWVSEDSDLRIIQDALTLSTNVLSQDKSQLASQLIGRLGSQSAKRIRALVKGACAWQGAPWLHPVNANLHPPGTALLRTLKGHSGHVSAVAMSMDGQWVVSGGDDHIIKVWDLDKGRELKSFQGHSGWVRSLAMTADGQRLVSGAEDHTLRVWDFEGKRELHRLRDKAGEVCAVAVTADGRQAVSASCDNTLKVWDLETGTCLISFSGHGDRVVAVALSADGRRAVSGSWDDTLKVWDLQRGMELYTLRGHTQKVLAVALSADGRRAVSGCEDHTVKVWDVESGKELHTFEGHLGGVQAVTISSDGRRAASAGASEHIVRVWDVVSGRLLQTLVGHAGDVQSLAMNADGKRLVSSASDEMVKVWTLEGGRELPKLEGHISDVWDVAISGDGRRAVSGSKDMKVKVWELDRRSKFQTIEGYAAGVTAVALNSDGRQVLSGALNHMIRLWSLGDNGYDWALEGLAPGVSSVALSADGRRAVFGSCYHDVQVWDLEKREVMWTLRGHSGGVIAVALSADGRRVVSGSYDRTIRIWNLETGQEMRTIEAHSDAVKAFGMSADGRRGVSAGVRDGGLKVWDLENGQEMRTFRAHVGWVTTVGMSSDGRHLISGGTDHTIKIWDTASGECLAAFTGESGMLCCALWSDNRTIVAGEKSGRIHFLRLVMPDNNPVE